MAIWIKVRACGDLRFVSLRTGTSDREGNPIEELGAGSGRVVARRFPEALVAA
jgi:hypothetical protein